MRAWPHMKQRAASPPASQGLGYPAHSGMGPVVQVTPKGTIHFLMCFVGISSDSTNNTLKNNVLMFHLTDIPFNLPLLFSTYFTDQMAMMWKSLFSLT